MGITDKTRGKISSGETIHLGGHKLSWGTTAPSEGTFARGDIIFNEGATAGATGGAGFICTVGGTTGGTWVAFGNTV